jgi:uncharacterized protein YjiS (DUF1127 family)
LVADAPLKPPGRRSLAPVSDGKARLFTLSDLDSRTRACRHALELRAGLLSDLGGESETSIAERELVQRAAVLGAMLEDLEVRYLNGEDADPQQYSVLLNAQRRVLADIGLKRRPRDVVSIDSYLAKETRSDAKNGDAAE